MLDTELRSRVRQVVILGAGLDTRAVRKPAHGVSYFEIDAAATLELKRTRYQECGVEANVKFVPGNYVTDGVIALLARTDFDFDLPTYLIWEGNTMYLPLDATRAVLAELNQHVTRFHVSFDYMAEAVVSKTTGDAGITRLVESFATMGAPWLSGFPTYTLSRQIRTDPRRESHHRRTPSEVLAGPPDGVADFPVDRTARWATDSPRRMALCARTGPSRAPQCCSTRVHLAQTRRRRYTPC